MRKNNELQQKQRMAYINGSYSPKKKSDNYSYIGVKNKYNHNLNYSMDQSTLQDDPIIINKKIKPIRAQMYNPASVHNSYNSHNNSIMYEQQPYSLNKRGYLNQYSYNS